MGEGASTYEEVAQGLLRSMDVRARRGCKKVFAERDFWLYNALAYHARVFLELKPSPLGNLK